MLRYSSELKYRGQASMKIGLAQINTTIGDFGGNTKRIIDATARARSEGADLVVFPELSICGYPPMDLLDHSAFVEQSQRHLRILQQEVPDDVGVVLGYVDKTPHQTGKSLQNVAALIVNGRVLHRQAKRLLPTYDVFDEARYFEPGVRSEATQFSGIRLGIAICEDVWWETEPVPGTRYPVDPVRDLADQGVELLIVPSASPFHSGKQTIRANLMEHIGRNNRVAAVYVNLVGANDNLIFDGYSFATDAGGKVVARARGFDEQVLIIDSETLLGAPRGNTAARPSDKPPRDQEPAARPSTTVTSHTAVTSRTPGAAVTSGAPRNPVSYDADPERYKDLESALVLGVRDYLQKTGFRQVHFGLSGGIDSAVVAVLAVRALGAENVKAFLLPSRYSSPGSISDSEALVENLGVSHSVLTIEPIYHAFTEALSEEFSGTNPNVAEENIQARSRGTLLMAYSNKFGSLTLATGNKSELAVGYATLYGDMAGALEVIGDLFKTEVYGLARHMNRSGEVIPQAILDKAPSAELRPDQKDEDSLPPYDILDPILYLYLVESRTFTQIVQFGYDPAVVGDILRKVGIAEYKRRQAPPVLKVSPRAFGTGRRMPIARSIYEHHQ